MKSQLFSFFQVINLNQDVSKLAKELHNIMDFLQSHMAMLPNTSPASTSSYSIQMLHNSSVTTSSHWQPDVPLNIATGLPVYHEMISHPARNAWHSSGIPSQGTGPTPCSSSPVSSHLCCSDRNTTQRLQNMIRSCSPFQTTRTTLNSPYVTYSLAQGGPSIPGICSAFSGYPMSCQALHMVNNAQIPKSTHPLCSTVNGGYSQPPLSALTNSDLSHNQAKSHTPIHLSTTPSAQPRYHTTFSSLTPSRVHATVCTGHEEQRGSVGSSPVSHAQDLACSWMEQANTDCKASLHQERTESMESHGIGDSIIGMKEGSWLCYHGVKNKAE